MSLDLSQSPRVLFAAVVGAEMSDLSYGDDLCTGDTLCGSHSPSLPPYFALSVLQEAVVE